ncbi:MULTISPECIES: phosphatase PAP2 family protein [Flavobacteriaceae]|jgi:membrane-associated phospholipid phosphatase|uniref:Phosphatase PAP2 family protein n=1 Tax=Winogradskyella marincola TaxID=3037795 RepID=A0ABT6FXT5_9FLAO|nr:MULTISPECIES: phosphatase PAP2 family protein [Flavobacteriaceae]MDG4714591.1 phosphatase PAP2 family protein [Winogradskyella sp. YYF002]TBV27911.1 PAP2 family protein [Meridianimaribacter sp. CL38]
MKITNLKISLLVCVTLFLVILPTQAQDTSQTKPDVGTTQKIGDVILFALPAATIGTSFIIGDEKGAWQFTKGLLLTEAITYGLKLSINKQRPDMSNDNSFPSGHTSTVFHSAGYIHRRYGFKYSIPAYALAGFTAASRIDSKKHDILDVLAGAAIGLGSNLLFTTEYQQKHMELTFNKEDGGYLLGFTYKF